MDFPFVSIIIVNYNGAHFLPVCLDALQIQTYPQDRFEIIVSDNASVDNSISLMQSEYPWVRVLENGENLGFASGNNVAIEATNSRYVVLLNNDTAPESDWLENIVKVAEDYPGAGMVTGHLQLFYDQLDIHLHSDTFVPPGDNRDLGIQIFEVRSGTSRGVVQYLDGFYGWEPHPSGQRFRWTQGQARLGIPTPIVSDEWTINFKLAASRQDDITVSCQIIIDGHTITNLEIAGSDPVDYSITLPHNLEDNIKPVIQNSGSIVFYDGSSRDRGTYIHNSEVIFETDNGQYDKVEEVFSGCGASLLIRREMLEDVGVFDDDFFMYYEDTDLAWRARLMDWKVMYAPSAIVRHIHCGTTVEWSPFFFYHVDRNRLAMVFKNGEFRQILWAWGKYLVRTSLDAWTTLRALVKRAPNWRSLVKMLQVRVRVLIALIRWMPTLLRKRRHIQSRRELAPNDLRDWFVEQS